MEIISGRSTVDHNQPKVLFGLFFSALTKFVYASRNEMIYVAAISD